MFNEIKPAGGWLRHYRMKKNSENIKQVALLVFLAILYLAGCTYSFPF